MKFWRKKVNWVTEHLLVEVNLSETWGNSSQFLKELSKGVNAAVIVGMDWRADFAFAHAEGIVVDLAALLDYICLGIGRLDLLASVGLSRDPGLSDGEPDISPLAPQPTKRHSWHLSARQLCRGPKGSRPHILWPSAFPSASSRGWVSQWLLIRCSQLRGWGGEIGIWCPWEQELNCWGNEWEGICTPGGVWKPPSELARCSYRKWRERAGLRWIGWGAVLGRGCQAVGCESSEPESIMSFGIRLTSLFS